MSTPILLSRSDIANLMSPADYLEAVEQAFLASKAGCAPSPAPMHIAGTDGGAFHAKGAALFGARNVAAVKLNGNFPANPQHGLPTIQGVVLLCDAQNGAVLAILDSIEITLRRTAAASALAARHLARGDARTLAIGGCGAQARAHVEALTPLFGFESVRVWDIDAAKAELFARTVALETGLRCTSVPRDSLAPGADIIVTCTTARSPFLAGCDPGTFIAAVGADNPGKSEIAPRLMAQSRVVVDVLAQCVAMGDLHHAIDASVMRADDVHADLGDILSGEKIGRISADQTFIFDSTGTGIQDVASALVVYERAMAQVVGTPFEFSA